MAQVLHGARGNVKINGQIVGFIGGVNVNVENTLTDVDVIGNIYTGDFAETGHKCNFSISYFKALDGSNSMANIGLSANTAAIDSSYSQNNGAVQTGQMDAMREQAYFDVDIVDSGNGGPNAVEKIVFAMRECKFEGGSGQMDARGIWQGTANFKAKKGFGL